MTNKNFIGTIESETKAKSLAVLKATNDGDVVSATPFEIFDTLQGKRIQFHLPIKANRFKVLSVEGDAIDDLINIIEI
jgi:hypothetical protein